MPLLPYTPHLAPLWDDCVRQSRNGSFLFLRPFMDYHNDRFQDASLLYRSDKGKLLALFPASLHESGLEVRSHGGLTYGGWIISDQVTMAQMRQILVEMVSHYAALGVERMIVKPIPHFYHRYPSEEELYGWFELGANLSGRSASSLIDLKAPLPYSASRARNVRTLSKSNLQIVETEDMADFHCLLSQTLAERHEVKPVHSLEELQLLRSRFPKQIRCFELRNSQHELLCGVLLFVHPQVVHLQYIASSPLGRKSNALDFLVDGVIEQSRSGKISHGETPRYLDFGISTEQGGRVLNDGLINQKERFGARCCVYDEYELNLQEACKRIRARH